MSFYPKHFSHIYIEEAAYDYTWCREILSRFNSSELICVENYKDIISRYGQSFNIQKKSKNLILAVKKSGFLYDSSRFAQNLGHRNLFYNALSLNCLYDCSYCYLQGIHSTANLVCFINIEDYFTATKDAISTRKHPNSPLALSLSLDTDLLAFEKIVPYCRRWIDFAHNNSDFVAEIRTKSTNFHSISDISPTDRVLLAWTLSPDEIAAQYELGAPEPKDRLSSARAAADRGWSIRLCFDPVIPVKGWKKIYVQCVESAFSNLPIDCIHDATIGVFRMSTAHLRLARKNRPQLELLQREWDVRDGTASCHQKEREEIVAFMKDLILQWLPEERIAVWT